MAMRTEIKVVVRDATAFENANNKLAVSLVALFGVWQDLSEDEYKVDKATLREAISNEYERKGRKPSAAKSMADNICAMGNNWRKLVQSDRDIIASWTQHGGSQTIGKGKDKHTIEWSPFGYDTLKRTISSRLAELDENPAVRGTFVNPYFRKSNGTNGKRGGNTAKGAKHATDKVEHVDTTPPAATSEPAAAQMSKAQFRTAIVESFRLLDSRPAAERRELAGFWTREAISYLLRTTLKDGGDAKVISALENALIAIPAK